MGGWVVREAAHADEFHVLPLEDIIDHYATECACGPRTEPQHREDGSIGWLVVHHSLDGREGNE